MTPEKYRQPKHVCILCIMYNVYKIHLRLYIIFKGYFYFYLSKLKNKPINYDIFIMIRTSKIISCIQNEIENSY